MSASKTAPKKGKRGNAPQHSKTTSTSKNRQGARNPSAPPKQQKSHRFKQTPPRKNHLRYTEEQLDLPKLNTIAPAGVQKPKGKKKGKVFVDDAESMMTILAMVNADKEGQIESKITKARQMEEIREARRRETERKEESKRQTLEQTKEALKKRRKKKYDGVNADAEASGTKKNSKRVSFA